jgi:hypothetical protein
VTTFKQMTREKRESSLLKNKYADFELPDEAEHLMGVAHGNLSQGAEELTWRGVPPEMRGLQGPLRQAA